MSADTVWPPALTRTPRVADLEENAPDVVVRSEIDVGPAKIRRRFTGDRRRFAIGIDFKRTELATFDDFFVNTTKGGALSFSWKLPRTAAAADFRFLSVPVYRPQAPRYDGAEWWRVSFDVEMIPGTDSAIVPPVDGVIPPAFVYSNVGWNEEDPEPEVFEQAIVFGVVNEADAIPPDFLPGGYGYIGDENPDEEDAATSIGSSFSMKSSDGGGTPIDGSAGAGSDGDGTVGTVGTGMSTTGDSPIVAGGATTEGP